MTEIRALDHPLVLMPMLIVERSTDQVWLQDQRAAQPRWSSSRTICTGRVSLRDYNTSNRWLAPARQGRCTSSSTTSRSGRCHLAPGPAWSRPSTAREALLAVSCGDADDGPRCGVGVTEPGRRRAGPSARRSTSSGAALSGSESWNATHSRRGQPGVAWGAAVVEHAARTAKESRTSRRRPCVR